MDNELLWDENQIEEAKCVPGPILIIGVSGFIGANLYRSLQKFRTDIYGCSRNPNRSWRLIGCDQSHLINLDINNIDQVRRVISTLRPQTVVNLATYGAYSRQADAEKIHLTNYIGTFNLLKCLNEIGCSSFIQAGTSSEYGTNCSFADEKFELVPNSDYSVSKISADYLVRYYGSNLGFPGITLRLFSVYGPWEERDRFIPNLVKMGLQKKYPLFVEKEISRDFVYIDDCNNAIIKAALTICKSHPGISVNIATGQKTSIEEVAFISKELFQIPELPQFGTLPNKKWDIQDWYGNPKLANNLLNWYSKTSFEAGLKKTISWEREIYTKLTFPLISNKSKVISIVIACYKDVKSIPILYKRIYESFFETEYNYEIIFVNDGSPYDDERAIYDICIKDNNVIGITHSRNFGSQSAFISGMSISSGDAVVLMDGDGQDPPEMIIEFIKKWEEGFEIVYGERVKRKAPFYMQLFYKLFYRIFKSLSDIRVPVDAGDFSLIDRKAVSYLLKFTEKDIFIRGLRAWIGFKQIGVPYYRPERLFGKSTNSFMKNIWWAKKGIFSFSTKPLQYIQSIGFIVFMLTSLMVIFYLIEYFINKPVNANGIPTIILIVLGLGGIQLISISILGDYIGKIIEEVKNRPNFIRNQIIYNGKSCKTQEEIEKVIDEINRKNTRISF